MGLHDLTRVVEATEMQSFFLFCLLSISLAATITHTVSCSAGLCGPGGSYTIDGLQNPNLECLVGDTHTFNINTPGHPFAIRVSRGGAPYSPVAGANPTAAGTISVECNASFKLSPIVYQCTAHPAMAGGIYNPKGTPIAPDLPTFLGGHNNERALWTGLNQLQWDGRLVAVGQAFANNCSFDFDLTFIRARQYAAMNGATFSTSNITQYLGINVGFEDLSASLVVKNNWTCLPNTCNNSQGDIYCNIYRQIVDNRANLLGCAVSQCNASDFGFGFNGQLKYWVCSYYTGGLAGHPFAPNQQYICNGLPIPVPVPVPVAAPTPVPVPAPVASPADPPLPPGSIVITPANAPSIVPSLPPELVPTIIPVTGPLAPPVPAAPTVPAPTFTPAPATVPSPDSVPAPGTIPPPDAVPSPASPPSNTPTPTGSPAGPPTGSPDSPNPANPPTGTPDSPTGTPDSPTGTPDSPSPSPGDEGVAGTGLQPWGIALIILGIILIFCILFMIVMCIVF